ncbi:MAG: hypothetical protein ACYSSI_08835 [Planctomycetota bacterium]|jgi:hypothetical protein
MANKVQRKVYNEPVVEEIVAAAAITPGMLLEPTSADKVQVHSTAEGNALPMFALEDQNQGNDIDDAYAADDQVLVWFPQRGEMIEALLADGETIVIGDYLASNGDGYLRKHDPDDSGGIQVQGIVAQAVQALDLSDSSGGDPSSQRITVRAI